MSTIYHDQDARIETLEGRRIGVIGYGNQGRAQALNMRDSGLDPQIGNIADAYADQAVKDGFAVRPIAEVAAASDVLLILVPDEVQPVVFASDITPHLRPGDLLCFASGYNIHFRQIPLPETVDVVMVAPRMIGQAVRNLFVRGDGYPCLVGIDQDPSGKALDLALGIAKAIGATRLGAFSSSFEEEATIDLFAEQMLWPAITRLCTLYFEKLVACGCDPDIVATELHLSGEFLEISRAMITEGFFKQLKLHSHTSQYGQLSRGSRMVSESVEREADAVLDEIRSGAFAREWRDEQDQGLPTLKALWQQALAHPLSEAEARLEDLRQVVAKAHLNT
jgi:ketol-acid reductoisomerase